MSTPDPALTEWVPLAVGGGGPIGPEGPAGPAGPQGPPGSIPARLGPGAVLVTDMNQANETGFYYCDYDPLNSPGYGQWCIWVIKHALGVIQQIAVNSGDDTGAYWVRAFSYGSWGSWYNVYNSVPDRLAHPPRLQPSGLNFNNTTSTGWYLYDSSGLNPPLPGFSWFLRVEGYDSNNVVQTAWVRNSSSMSSYMYHRVRINGTWSAWRCVYPVLMATTFPSNPIDGMEAVLVDSVTAPTYQWRFRYVAAKSTNKWVFIGGSPAVLETASQQNHTTVNAYAALGTANDFAIPVAGDYIVELGALLATGGAAGTALRMSYDIGATGAVDADALTVMAPQTGAGNGFHAFRRRKKLGLTAVTLAVKYKTSSTNIYAQERTLSVTPIAVGG